MPELRPIQVCKNAQFSATAQLIGAQTVEPSEKLLIADRDSQNNSVPGHLDINNSADWTQCLYQSTKWRSSWHTVEEMTELRQSFFRRDTNNSNYEVIAESIRNDGLKDIASYCDNNNLNSICDFDQIRLDDFDFSDLNVNMLSRWGSE